jgi:hypothetical protein
LTCWNYSHVDAMDFGSLEDHHMNQETQNLDDVEEFDNDGRWLALKTLISMQGCNHDRQMRKLKKVCNLKLVL